MDAENITSKLISEELVNLNTIDINKFAIKYGFKALGAFLIIIVTIIIMKAGGKIIQLGLYKAKVEHTLANFLSKLFKVIILVLGIMAALNNLGVDTTSFVAFFTATSFAISFAFKETLSNIASGILLIIFRPFVMGDIVKVGAGEGEVSDISLFSVTLKTKENVNIIIPNSKVVNDNIINYSREKIRRITFIRTIDPANLCTIRKEVNDILGKNQLILNHPPLFIGVNNVNTNDIEICIQFWVKNEDYERVLHLTNEEISKIFLGKYD